KTSLDLSRVHPKPFSRTEQGTGSRNVSGVLILPSSDLATGKCPVCSSFSPQLQPDACLGYNAELHASAHFVHLPSGGSRRISSHLIALKWRCVYERFAKALGEKHNYGKLGSESWEEVQKELVRGL
ncbi:hypothetical protein BaRGS_00025613, partial [Batillaria attramentaria]